MNDRRHGGFHTVLEVELPYVFIDATMQIWPDAEIDKAHRHGVTAYVVTACRPHDEFADVVRDLSDWHRLARSHQNLVVAETVASIRHAKAAGKAALVLAAQGGDFIGRELHRVEAAARLGLRQLLLAYNATNQLADGCLDRTEGGLSRLGERVVEECNRVGILLDGTHTGKRSTLDIIDRSAHPVVFSHSNPSAIAPNRRNIDDEQIRACAARGGVICLAPWGPLVMRPGTAHQPTVDEFIHMIDHVASLTGGTDHIGIGTDMSLGSYPRHERDPWGAPDYGNPFAEYADKVTADPRSPRRNLDGFSDYAEIASFADRLGARGYTDNDVHKILGENYLRVASAAWSAG
ncbi:MAG TPA: membrane dipeptidase [Vicinamibacteria bacterium]|nr:membrane dipeptidase [Vicinamibacteria bacterium]